MTAKIIPRFEPEVIEAAAQKRHWGDAEKVATTSIRTLVVFGVDIISRYHKAAEYELMQAVVCTLHPTLRKQIISIFCDSKANCFSIVLRTWRTDRARVIGLKLERAAIEQWSGHNGISVAANKGNSHYFGDPWRCIEMHPNWQDDGP